MFCPECGGEITSTGKFNLGINNSGEYICENCNIKINIYEEELDNPYSYENSDAYLDMNWGEYYYRRRYYFKWY